MSSSANLRLKIISSSGKQKKRKIMLGILNSRTLKSKLLVIALTADIMPSSESFLPESEINYNKDYNMYTHGFV